MCFRGAGSIRRLIFINDGILEQINNFNCLGYNISYEGEKDLNVKVTNFVRIL
jgi:hypothetical protein